MPLGGATMGNVGYNSLVGLLRVTEAGRKKPDPFVTDVLTYHAALEFEMDQFLALSLPNSGRLQGFGFQQKISLIGASWRGTRDSCDKLTKALIRFNDLRNSVAHNDSEAEVQRHLLRLREATRAFAPTLPATADVTIIAVCICAFMDDNPKALQTAMEIMGFFRELANSVKLTI